MQLRSSPAHPHSQVSVLLPGVRRALQIGLFPNPRQGQLPALYAQSGVPVHPLRGGVHVTRDAEGSHPGQTLRGFPQVFLLPHGLQEHREYDGAHHRAAPHCQPQKRTDNLQVFL